jgi:predicted nucleic acid-binding protein
MILADTSVWIEHFRSGSKELEHALNRGQVVMHPWIVTELALGSLHDRRKTLSMLDMLPQVRVAATKELRHMIETRRLFNLGIGLTDAHLIASALLSPPTLLWTKDKQLRRVAEALQLHVNLP